MSRWWKRGREPREQRERQSIDLESELRALRPAPRPELVDSITDRVVMKAHARPQYHRLSRLSFAAALTTLVLGTLASFGGLSHAATGTVDALQAVKSVAADNAGPRIPDRSPAQTQYGGEDEEVEVTTVVRTQPGGGAPGGGAPGGGAPVSEVAGVTAAGQLPLTGLGLVTTALVGLGFAGLGLALLRASRMPEGS